MNSDGFYCTTTQPFSPGERLACLVVLPAQSAGAPPRDRFYLEGQVEVIRLVVSGTKGFGIGCRIREYQMINGEALPPWAVAAGVDHPPFSPNGEPNSEDDSPDSGEVVTRRRA